MPGISTAAGSPRASRSRRARPTCSSAATWAIDFETKGLAVYRLLDATVTFHRGLPAAGEVIRYDIRITNFFRQGKTILFRFQFDATVAGEPLLTMRDGCAGFFTPEELAAGKGIVPRALDLPVEAAVCSRRGRLTWSRCRHDPAR